MPTVTREAIYAALFALTAPLTPTLLTSRSRILENWDKVQPEEQPAFFQLQRSESFEQRAGLPALRTLTVDWIVYVNRTGDVNQVPSQSLNPILDALEDAISPSGGQERQTLGGLVSHAWIAGAVEIFEGVLGPQVIAILPIQILSPPDLKGVGC